MLEIKVYRDLVLRDIIYEFEKLETRVSFYDVGDFSIAFNHDPMLIYNDILEINGTFFIVEDILRYRDLSKKTVFVLKGKCIKSLLQRRVLPAKVVMDPVFLVSAIQIELNKAFIASGARRIEGFKIGTHELPQNDGNPIYRGNRSLENMNLHDFTMEMLSSLKGYSYKINVFPNRKEFVFSICKADDKSNELFFGEEFSNLSDIEYNTTRSKGFNACYNNGNLIREFSSGWQRREGYGDRCIFTKDYVSGRILQNEYFIYGKDWKLGDYILLKGDEFNVKKQVVEVKEFFSSSYTLEVVLGD